jgi:archaellum biogenesis protein FlaJ (TadC family)
MVCESSSPWVVNAIGFVLFIGACLCVVLMQKAEKDQQINRVDSKPLMKARRLSFIAVAMSALITILTILARPDAFLPLLLLMFSFTDVLLFVDIMALEGRPGSGKKHSVDAAHSWIRGPIEILNRFTRRY